MTSDPEDTTTVPCDCIRLTNEGLARDGHNTRILTSWLFNRETGGHRTVVKLAAEVVEKKRGARPITLIPEFCPFCGQRYEAKP